MGDAHPAEHDMIAFAELVNIEAETGAHIAQGCEPGGLGTDEIVVRGELDVCGFTLERADLDACPFGERGVIAEIVATRCFRPAMRLQQGGKTESLRGLHQAHARAVDRVGHAACCIVGFDGVSHADDGDGRSARACGGDRPRNEGRGRERPGRIVHQHEVGSVSLQCLEAGTHGGLPQCSPVHRRQQIEADARRLEQGGVIGMDHRLHEGDRIMPSEEGEARADHRLA